MHLYQLLDLIEAMEVYQDCNDLTLRPGSGNVLAKEKEKPKFLIDGVDAERMMGSNSPDAIKMMESIGVPAHLIQKAKES